MGLFEGKGQLDRAVKDLLLKWQVCRSSWRDEVAAEFEQKHLLPLQQRLKSAASAMTTAAGLVAKIKSDVADRE